MKNWTTSHDRVLAQRRAEGWMFLIDAARELRAASSVAPGSTALARLLTDPVRLQAPHPLAVLYTGADSDALTSALIAQLPRGSRLDIAEPNPRLASPLRSLVAAGPGRADRHVEMNVYQTGVQDLDTAQRYDVIVSGRPLSGFTPVQVERIMARSVELLHPGGTLTYWVHLGLGDVLSLLSPKTGARRRAVVDKVVADYQRTYTSRRWNMWAHLPPVRVWHLQRPLVSMCSHHHDGAAL
ncbi:translation initiation factor IF-2 [Streptomyces sp. NPDC096311]|uniref:translation initiation factor IF-2 n=1 Tax=Streptomyces sp. NPDC096311 TaxID=3366083 RepID=UPI00380B9F4C